MLGDKIKKLFNYLEDELFDVPEEKKELEELVYENTILRAELRIIKQEREVELL